MKSPYCAALAAAALAVFAADAAVSSRSYAQRGLVAQYDGINNVAHDAAHNPSAKTWRDLTGNGIDGTCEASSKFAWVGGDGWSVSGDCKPVTIPAPGLAATMGSCSFTIQFACTPAMDNKREAFFSQYNYTSAYGGFGLEHNSGSNFSGKLRYYKFNSRTGNAPVVDEVTTAKIAAGSFTSASVAISPTLQKCWLNGTLADTRSKSFSMISYSTPSVIGGEPQWMGSRTGVAYTDGYGITFQGKYNAFRLYDRPLSEDEAKVNAAVDAIRFNGANPSDFVLTGGWSFDGSGDLCVDVAATVSGNGTVAVNGGGASVTVRQYASPVALAATPASGYVFYRWEGDTDAIVSGSALTPSIEVSATDPVSLVAVFKVPTQGLNAYSYIRRGLVANFDGIDNAGTGSHDSSATTWVDLTGNGNDAAKGSNASWNGMDGWTSSADGKPMTVPEGNGAATTIAGTTVTKVFTAQFAAKPSRHNVRQCFFGQWDSKGVSIEHNGGNNTMDGHMRAYYHYLPGTASDEVFGNVLVTSGEWASMSLLSDTARQTFWKNGETSQTIVKELTGTLTNRCPSVIGGDNARDGMGFRGTYNAFRLYNRVLSIDEVKVNAAIDDRRFNAGAKGLAFPAGWSYADNMLMVDVSATAAAGGKISYRGGAAAQSVADTVNHDGSKILSFAAVPDAGYVFERWSGDTDLIVAGSTITSEITVDPDRPVTLVAKFRRCGDATDGKIYDLSFTGDAAADGITFSDTVAEEKQGYVAADIALPILPTVTNDNVSCIYLPQPTNGIGGTYRQMATSDKPAVTGDVATVFVRFRWDGPVFPADAENYAAVILNGYNGWRAAGQGFIVRLTSPKDSTDGYPSFVVAGRVIEKENAAIEDVSGTGFVKPNEWVDLFASVYPSPTDPTLSNADIWYCRTPAWLTSGNCFTASTIGHRHFGDAAKIPKMDSTTGLLRFGAEPTSTTGVSSDESATKVFRGAIAGAKGWNRLLSEDEMWTVMAEFDGVQSFGGGNIFSTGALTTQEGRNGTPTAFIGDTATEHFWRALKKSYPPITLVWNAPKDRPAMPVVYSTAIANFKTGNTQPIHLEANGKTVWSSAGVARDDKIRVEIDAAYTRPGLNELKWVYDTDVADNWVSFRAHRLRLGSIGMVIILR